jgi:heme A synthase
MVTSFRAGMADPIWPTEPWYLADNFKLDFGYLIEHSHRIVGFVLGVIVSILAFGILWGEPRPLARSAAALGLVVLLAGYGEFHRGLMAQQATPATTVTMPLRGGIVTIVGLTFLLGVCFSGLIARSRGSTLRAVMAFALLGVMIQGLLGGFRVKLNALIGTDLAAIHGVFAQVVFGLLVGVAVLTARVERADFSSNVSRSLSRAGVCLAALLLVQIALGALVRHDPDRLTQRLHLLTAFLATAAAVWVLRSVFADPDARSRAGSSAGAFAVLLAIQLYLGVEAWLAKFGASVLPEEVPITVEYATIRTLHALVGSGLWATSLVLAFRLRAVDLPLHTLDSMVASRVEENAPVAYHSGASRC